MRYNFIGCNWRNYLGKDPTNPRGSEHGLITEPALNPLMILLKVKLTSGSAWPRDKYDDGTICLQLVIKSWGLALDSSK